MRSLLAPLAVLLALTCPARAEDRARWEPGKTYALFVGVLEWKDPALAAFPKENRQDRALAKTLEADGVPASNVHFLEDGRATLAAIRAELAATLEQSGEGSTFVFYFAGHGLREDGGQTYFANHDCDTKDDAHTAFALAELQKTLHAKFRGSRLLLLADCCHSGALGDVVRSFDDSKTVKAACLTSSTASNVSTGHWTFTESLVAAFARDGRVDLDRDGTVTFAEADGYVHREMRWREEQLTRGARSRSFESELALGAVDTARKAPEGGSGPWKVLDYAECSWKDQWYKVQVTAAKDGRLRVHYLGWGAEDDEWVEPGRLRAPPALPVKTGSPCEVEWHGKWWKAKVVASDEAFAFVHYDGYGPEWDEWVTGKRLRLAGAVPEKKDRRRP